MSVKTSCKLSCYFLVLTCTYRLCMCVGKLYVRIRHVHACMHSANEEEEKGNGGKKSRGKQTKWRLSATNSKKYLAPTTEEN